MPQPPDAGVGHVRGEAKKAAAFKGRYSVVEHTVPPLVPPVIPVARIKPLTYFSDVPLGPEQL